MNSAQIRHVCTVVIASAGTVAALSITGALDLSTRQSIAVLIIATTAAVTSAFADKLAGAFRSF